MSKQSLAAAFQTAYINNNYAPTMSSWWAGTGGTVTNAVNIIASNTITPTIPYQYVMSPPLTKQQLQVLQQMQRKVAGGPSQYMPSPAPSAAPQTFNKYVNASDLLEEFIAYLGTEGVRKGEIMDLPVELFIKWLVIRACEVDQEEPGVVLTLPAPKRQPRCLGCGRWMVRNAPLLLHGPRCAAYHFARVAA